MLRPGQAPDTYSWVGHRVDGGSVPVRWWLTSPTWKPRIEVAQEILGQGNQSPHHKEILQDTDT
jgi:hypothetical protein